MKEDSNLLGYTFFRDKDVHLSPLMFTFITIVISTILFYMYGNFRHIKNDWWIIDLLSDWGDSGLFRVPFTLLITLILGFFYVGILSLMVDDSLENSELFINRKNIEFESKLTKLNKAPLSFILRLLPWLNILYYGIVAIAYVIIAFMTLFNSFDFGLFVLLNVSFFLTLGITFGLIHIFKNGEKYYLINIEMFSRSLYLNSFEQLIRNSFHILNSEYSIRDAVEPLYNKLGVNSALIKDYFRHFDFGGIFRSLILIVIVNLLKITLFILRPITGVLKAKYLFYILFIPSYIFIGIIYTIWRVTYIILTLFSTLLFYSLIPISIIVSFIIAASVLVINAPVFEWFYYVRAFDIWSLLFIISTIVVFNVIWGLLVWSLNYEFDAYYNPSHLSNTIKAFFKSSDTVVKVVFTITLLIGISFVSFVGKYTYDNIPPKYVLSLYKTINSFYIQNYLVYANDYGEISTRDSEIALNERLNYHDGILSENIKYMEKNPATFSFYDIPVINVAIEIVDLGLQNVSELEVVKYLGVTNKPDYIYLDATYTYDEAKEICEEKGYDMPSFSDLERHFKKHVGRYGIYWSSSASGISEYVLVYDNSHNKAYRKDVNHKDRLFVNNKTQTLCVDNFF